MPLTFFFNFLKRALQTLCQLLKFFKKALAFAIQDLKKKGGDFRQAKRSLLCKYLPVMTAGRSMFLLTLPKDISWSSSEAKLALTLDFCPTNMLGVSGGTRI